MSSNFKKQRLDELSKRLRKAKKNKTPKTEAEKEMELNNKPRPENGEVSFQEFLDRIVEIYCGFIERLQISPADFDQIMKWWDEGIPLKVVVMAMEDLIKIYYRKHGRMVTVRSLSYFDQQVGTYWLDHKEAMVGKRR